MKIVVYAQGVRPEVVKHIIDSGKGDIVAAKSPELEAAMADAGGLVLQDFTWTADILAITSRAPKLKWIQLLTSGHDRMTQYGAPDGVTICNARGAFSHSVAVHAISLYLALLRGVPAMLAQQKHSAWQRDFANTLEVPAQSNAVILGFGSIGQEIARLLKPFGPRIIGVSRSGAAHPLTDEIIASTDMRMALPRASAIFLAMPLDDATRHVIGRAELESCQRNAVLINVGRGALWDQQAVAQALHERLIAGAATDVTDPEPLPADHPLWTAPNFILSPHVSGASGELGYKAQAQIAIDNIARFRNGEKLENIIRI